MLIKGIDFPEELLRARDEGELVVFAGAGVSCPAPSSLPLFSALASQIGREASRHNHPNEPEDRFLGRLKNAGVEVHLAAARILLNPNSRPTSLHEHLLRLFPNAEGLRLVTTNFDTHFTTTAERLYADRFETYFAPALPLGDDFTGLVYLHGSAKKDPKRCVLTDEDFGRAYITQSWASRFLAAMFSRYVVLFVGYSHNDTVMNYLARGLPPAQQRPRFALTSGDHDSLGRWEFLGIRPLVYEKTEAENPHEAISVSIGEWVCELNRGLLEKGQRIRSIAEAQPPLAGEDADYITFALGKQSTRRFFFENARSPEWILWLEKVGLLKGVFDWFAAPTEFDRDVVLWLTKHFFLEHSSKVFASIERNGGRINPCFAWGIWRRLCSRNETRISNVYSKWIAILLTQPRHVLQSDDWCVILSNCRFPEDKSISLLLFDFITKGYAQTEVPWRVFGEGVAFRLAGSQEYWLKQAWQNVFLPNLAEYAGDLLPIVVTNLVAAHWVHQIGGHSSRNDDPFRLTRQSIDHPEPNSTCRPIEVLFDAAKAVLDNFLIERPAQATAILESWIVCDAAILRRFAVYGYGSRRDIDPDSKIEWIIQHDLVYRFKTDVFEFLQRCYPLAGSEARQRFIGRVREGPIDDQLEPRTHAYEIYNYLVWLNRIAPQCQLAHTELTEFQRVHPDFDPRDEPQLDFWTGGARFVDPTEGFEVASIGSNPAEDFVDQFLNFRPHDPGDLRDPSSVVAAVIANDPQWGLSWVRSLSDRQITKDSMWYSACLGWRNAVLTPSDWAEILGFAENCDAPIQFFSSFAENLESGSRGEQHQLPDDMMDQAQRVAERIWAQALESTPVDSAEDKDWLTRAINQPGGKLAQFWLRRISVARKIAGESWRELPRGIAKHLSKMLHASAGASVYVRIVFGSQLHYLFSLDPVFTQSELLPFFDWRNNELAAEQCWHGFLGWGRWLPGFTEQLRPSFDELLGRLNRMTDDLRRIAVSHVAGLALFRFDRPIDWLKTVLGKFEEADLIHFTSEIHRLLDDTPASTAEAIWDAWLKTYWELRLLGMPRPLLKKEATEMVHWSLCFGQRLSEALPLVQQMRDKVDFEHSDLIYRVAEKNLARAYPQPTAELLLFFFNSRPRNFYPDDNITKIWRDLKTGAPAETIRILREAMLAINFDPEQNSPQEGGAPE